MSEQFKLKLSNHNRNLSSEIFNLQQDGDFFDVTLVGDDGSHVEAHKIVLSASSESFKTMFKVRNHPYPLVYMKGLQSVDLNTLMLFIYKGEVTLDQGSLNQFITLARYLKVNGLEERLDERVHEIFDEMGSLSDKNLDCGDFEGKIDPLIDQVQDTVGNGIEQKTKRDIKEISKPEMSHRKRSARTNVKIEYKKDKCGYCERRFRTNYDKVKHEKIIHIKRSQPLQCTKPFCGATFDTFEQKVEHIRACVFKCTWNDCGKEIKRGARVETHMRAHSSRPHALLIPIRKSSNTSSNDDMQNADIETKLKGIWNKIRK